MNILLIDDEKLEAKLVGLALKKALGEGFNLDFSLTPECALKSVKSHDYDLILLDNMLTGGLTAKDLLPLLIPYKKRAELIIISNIIDKERLENELGGQVDDFVEKFYLKEYFIQKFKHLQKPVNRIWMTS